MSNPRPAEGADVGKFLRDPRPEAETMTRPDESTPRDRVPARVSFVTLAVRDMAEYLERGGRLVLFAEGRITTTGGLMKLFDGTGFLIRKTNAKVVTCYLRGANRLPWVRHSGWTKWFPRVSAHFSEALKLRPGHRDAAKNLAVLSSKGGLRGAKR